jgi:hypothetical protein
MLCLGCDDVQLPHALLCLWLHWLQQQPSAKWGQPFPYTDAVSDPGRPHTAELAVNIHLYNLTTAQELSSQARDVPEMRFLHLLGKTVLVRWLGRWRSSTATVGEWVVVQIPLREGTLCCCRNSDIWYLLGVVLARFLKNYVILFYFLIL